MAARNSRFLITATPVTIIAHLMGIVATTLVLVWTLHFRDGLSLKSENKQKIFNVHPVLMVIGFIFVAGEAIMAYKTIPGSRKARRAVHMALHLVALLVGILGVYTIFKFHREVGIPDMYSLHSWLGMGTICLFGLQWLLGFFSFWFPGAETSARVKYMPWHIFFGMAIFLMAICTAETGLVQEFIFLRLVHGREALVVNFIGVAILLFGLAVVFSALLPRYR
ncbi:putative ascorbate-specific transmembrane electron transporter 1 [Cinnamomum micranthum f. kanehirae]|uniref:Putative ascorbate-specific transmembrane electron transporter 1 n=1 Tax=Cinnamomum micranthum f. kanehirae TaxID=337451 RepID=A0A3S3NTS3_9MAGN|nr:putative ascorbate-specific transmembrane electron transporter 1 [Cinnamomum micranthum f. kanehirae]